MCGWATVQLEEVDPGAGRVFGLMSIVALPRRLSLDFRDVFNKGFGFDQIAGSFRYRRRRSHYLRPMSSKARQPRSVSSAPVDLVGESYDGRAP